LTAAQIRQHFFDHGAHCVGVADAHHHDIARFGDFKQAARLARALRDQFVDPVAPAMHEDGQWMRGPQKMLGHAAPHQANSDKTNTFTFAVRHHLVSYPHGTLVSSDTCPNQPEMS
jgi:hypothetical protein